MSKTFKKKLKHNDHEETHEDDYGYVKHSVNKSQQKRFDRALKTLDVDDLMDCCDRLDELDAGNDEEYIP